MTDAELDNLAHRTAIDCHISNGHIITLSGIILAALQKVSEAERRERGLKSIDRICDTCGGEKDSEGRCAMCLQATLTATEAQLAECQKEAEKAHAAYVIEHSGRGVDLKQLAAATAEVERLKGENEELLIKNNRLADDADKAEFYLKQSRQELAATEQKLRECEADTKRLDWLDKHSKGTFGIFPDYRDRTWSVVGNPTDTWSGGIHLGDGDTLRAAIDAAMSNQEKQQ